MRNFWQKFKAGLFTKTQFVTGVTITFLTTSALVYAFTHLSLFQFQSNTPIVASEVNANFEYLNERIKYLAGNQFVVKTDYDTTPLNLLQSTTVPIAFNEVLVDFTEGGDAQGLVDSGLFTINKTGGYSIAYEIAGSPVVSANAYGSVILEISSLGTGTFSNPCCGGGYGAYFYLYSSAADIPTTGGGLASFNSGDVIRFQLVSPGFNDDINLSLLKIKIKEN